MASLVGVSMGEAMRSMMSLAQELVVLREKLWVGIMIRTRAMRAMSSMSRVLVHWRSLKVGYCCITEQQFDVCNHNTTHGACGCGCGGHHSGQRGCSDCIIDQNAPLGCRSNSPASPLVPTTSNSPPIVSAPGVVASSSTTTLHETVVTFQDSTQPSGKRKQPNLVLTPVTAKVPAVIGLDSHTLKKR